MLKKKKRGRRQQMNLHEYAKKQMEETEKDIEKNIKWGRRYLKTMVGIIAFGAGVTAGGLLTGSVDALAAAALILIAAFVPIVLGLRQTSKAEDNQIWLDYYREIYYAEDDNGIICIRDRKETEDD